MAILVVDDHENMCWILSKILSGAGFSVKTANTAQEALAIAAKGGICAAVIDFRLQDGNGFDLFRNLKANNRDLPGILITSYGSSKLQEQALELGFYAYFDKPFDNNAFITIIKEILKT